jgi:hypothetical protein
MLSATANVVTDVVVVRFPEPVDCNGAGHAQFAYLESGKPIPQGATSLVCDGTSSIRLTFADGVLTTGAVAPVLRYRESSVQNDRVSDSSAQWVTSGEEQAMTVES